MVDDPGYPLDDVRTRAERQRVDRTLSRHERGWVDRAETLDVDGSASLAIPDRSGFWASVVGLLTSSPPTYAFEKLIGDGNDPRALVTDSQGVATDGTTHLPCAYEVNLNPSVPTGAVVWVVPGVGGPTTGFWEFSWQAAGNPLNPTYPSGSTVAFASGSNLVLASGSTTTYAATSTLVLAGPAVNVSQSTALTVATGQTFDVTGPGTTSITTANLNVGGSTAITLAGSPISVTDNLTLTVAASKTLAVTGNAFVVSTTTASFPSSTTVGGSPVVTEATAAVGRRWIKVQKTHTDLSTAATTNEITLYTVPIRGIVHNVRLKPTIQVAGTGLTTYTLDVKMPSGNSLSLSVDGMTSITATSYGVAFEHANPYLGSGYTQDYGATQTVKLTALSSGANLSAATAGAWDIFLEVSVPP